jgi:hypothetical protein
MGRDKGRLPGHQHRETPGSLSRLASSNCGRKPERSLSLTHNPRAGKHRHHDAPHALITRNKSPSKRVSLSSQTIVFLSVVAIIRKAVHNVTTSVCRTQSPTPCCRSRCVLTSQTQCFSFRLGVSYPQSLALSHAAPENAHTPSQATPRHATRCN